jgi:hypothetical protein
VMVAYKLFKVLVLLFIAIVVGWTFLTIAAGV